MSNQIRAYLDLISLLDMLGCPKKSFGVILNQWVKKYCHSTKDTTDFQPAVKHQTHDHVLKNLATQLGLSQAPKPYLSHWIGTSMILTPFP
jgi:hypothetical protein